MRKRYNEREQKNGYGCVQKETQRESKERGQEIGGERRKCRAKRKRAKEVR